jgi:hypothetical protein
MGEVDATEWVTERVRPPAETGRGYRAPEVFHLLEASERAVTALEARFGALGRAASQGKPAVGIPCGPDLAGTEDGNEAAVDTTGGEGREAEDQ